MSLILPRNPFAYPSGTAAGINPNHVALSGGTLRFSGVARSGNFVDLTRGIGGTTFGSPVRVIDGNIGDSVRSSAAAGMTFSGRATSDPKMTFAAIVKWVNVAAATFSFVFANSGSTSGYNAIWANTDGSLGMRYAGGNVSSTVSLVANNIPYFIVGSMGAGCPIQFASVRLDTGSTLYNLRTTPGAYSDTPNGSYVLGNWPGLSNFGMVGSIAAFAYINGYLTQQQLLQWTQAPWDFWYPPTVSGLIMSSASSSGAAPGGGSQSRVMILA